MMDLLPGVVLRCVKIMTDKNRFENPELESCPIQQSDFEELLELQSSILGVAASSNDCADLMTQLCFMAEKLTPDSVASIMLYNKSDDRLYVHTAPSIPQEAIDALNGLQVGAGSCGNAVYHDEAMYVCNTLEDNRWCDTRSFAETFSIAACWSMPVHNELNEVIGTFALSSFEIREPTNFQCKLLHICASVTGILFQKENHLQQSSQWERESLRSEKLESIGVLAGGIAHDFNNLLSIVIGNIEMTERAVDKDSKALTYMSSAAEASRRAAELTQQLLTFSKGGDPIKKLSDLKEIVRDSAEFVLHGSAVSLTFDCNFDEDILVSEIDSGQISQVIQNIIINARQAMNNNGDINITCSNAVDLPENKNSELATKKYHKIELSDCGPGIPEDIVDKIFDPYFTTKSDGSGLGLALSFSIINKHDGYLFIDTEEGVGSCFTVYLPASDMERDKIFDTAPVVNIVKNKGCVLVMDDQDMLHEVAEAMLEELGYQSVHARNGTEAIEIFRQALDSENLIDALIMDLTIPGGMGGKEAIKEILSLDANANVIVCSGYSNDSVMSKFEDYGFKGALSKPYDIDELENTLGRILSER